MVIVHIFFSFFEMQEVALCMLARQMVYHWAVLQLWLLVLILTVLIVVSCSLTVILIIMYLIFDKFECLSCSYLFTIHFLLENVCSNHFHYPIELCDYLKLNFGEPYIVHTCVLWCKLWKHFLLAIGLFIIFLTVTLKEHLFLIFIELNVLF
jgi:hypothetical protein